ncbi:hypothetical protein [Streptomyces poriticola]
MARCPRGLSWSPSGVLDDFFDEFLESAVRPASRQCPRDVPVETAAY